MRFYREEEICKEEISHKNHCTGCRAIYEKQGEDLKKIFVSLNGFKFKN